MDYHIFKYIEKKKREVGSIPFDYYYFYINDYYTKKNLLTIMKKLSYRGFQGLRKEDICNFLYRQTNNLDLLI